MSRWPEGRRAAVSVTFDNLGEAAEIELGLRGADEPRGGHWSVTNALPIVLSELHDAGVPATFFVEGVNAEIYPEALSGIAAAGHEVGFHAFCHEDWAGLSATQEADNLDRGLAALRGLGLEVRGFRPPGGLIGSGTVELLAARGDRHCSPAGSAPGLDGGVAVLPFAWPAVDVFHVLPQFAALREHVSGSDEPGGADAVRAAMLDAVEQAVAGGGHAVLVWHTWMVEGVRDALRDVLARVAAGAASGELWAARCDAVGEWVRAHAHPDFAAPAALDRTSWTDPG
jgi:peptidoglycan/xylan/chitin deacetylase (PgdA/CDA1 family)